MKRVIAALAALMIALSAPKYAAAGLEPTTVFAVHVDNDAPVTIGNGVYNLPRVGEWTCAVGPMQGNGDFAVRSLVCGIKSAGLGVAVTAGCSRHSRDSDVQRLTIGGKDSGRTFLLVCMTDRFQES